MAFMSFVVTTSQLYDRLGSGEETALQTAASVIRAAARHLALRAKGQQPGEERTIQLTRVHSFWPPKS